MSFVPTFNLYESDGNTLVYAFKKVVKFEDNKDPSDFVAHKSLRGIGEIISPDSNTQGEHGNAPWELPMAFYFMGADYSDVIATKILIKQTIDKFTKYILKRDLTVSTTQDYKVMRLGNIDFPTNANGKKEVDWQKVELTFTVNAWQ